MTKELSRLGIIGGGRWAEVHKRALEAAGARLEAVLVASEGSRERVASDWGVRATTNLDEFLSTPIDAVIVASPNYLHAEHATRALTAGKHVLVEKPMATTLAGCDAILAAARRAQRTLAIGLEMRAFTLFATAKSLVDAGRIGRPHHLAIDLWRRPYRAGAGGWKTDPDKLGSPILEEPIHYLDLARWLLSTCGEPRSIAAWAASRGGRERFFENLDIVLVWPDARALVTRSIAGHGYHVSLTIAGEDGTIRAHWDGAMDAEPEPTVGLTLATSAEGPQAITVPAHTGHAYDVPLQTRAFLRAIREGAHPLADGEDGRAAVRLCVKAEEAVHRGAPLALDA
jgi:myo-inositol 2-dehydrogenase/D-chiro-inositol 1-dehydrogenase